MKRRHLSDDERLDWLRLSKCENVGSVTFHQLIDRFETATQALAGLPELSRRGGLKRTIRIYSRADAERDIAAAAAMDARFVAVVEPDYPHLLRHIDYPPPLICIKGRPELADQATIAIVGARNASASGRKLARNLAAELGSNGCTIISGLARGIDTAAHEASLPSGTIAVVAGGLDVIYPPENAGLQSEIAETGLLVSEMTPGTQPKAELFPRRNRLISGMALGVIVVEAAFRSGSLITARLAGEHGREVFAVPGSPLDPRAAGTNKLIQDGARLLTGASDVLDMISQLSGNRQSLDLDVHETDGQRRPGQSSADTTQSDRDKVVSLLGPSPVEIDDLIRESGCDAQTVVRILLELELAGRLARHAGQRISSI